MWFCLTDTFKTGSELAELLLATQQLAALRLTSNQSIIVNTMSARERQFQDVSPRPQFGLVFSRPSLSCHFGLGLRPVPIRVYKGQYGRTQRLRGGRFCPEFRLANQRPG